MEPDAGAAAASPDMASVGFPPVLLILGTDLSGKDHVANVYGDAALAAGVPMERRRGMFSAPADRRRSSEGKGCLALFLERLFLATLPLHCRFLPVLTTMFLHYDLWRFRPSRQRRLVVVSHTPIRLLAFSLGHLASRAEEVIVPPLAAAALARLRQVTAARVVVLDIAPEVRQGRLAERRRRGTEDIFDGYMRRDALRSERIEAILVTLAVSHLGAVVVENNDLEPQHLLSALLHVEPGSLC